MAELKLELYREVTKPMLRLFSPKQYASYKEALSFNGGYAFATATKLTIRKTDGTVFTSELSHYESDILTETYVGRLTNGEPFRFIFASNNNPLARIDPLVGFSGMSKSDWAVHYRVK